MIHEVLVATRNVGKVDEIRAVLQNLSIVFVTLDDVGMDPTFDVEETGTTFEENSLLKAKGYAVKSGMHALADDSGLIVDALDGRPGVYSKRYGVDDEDRIKNLLAEMQDISLSDRAARFVSVMTLCAPDDSIEPVVARGIVEGYITKKVQGDGGFGYDPIFYASELGKTFGEATMSEKNKVSHRARALNMLKELLINEKV